MQYSINLPEFFNKNFEKTSIHETKWKELYDVRDVNMYLLNKLP